MFDALGSHRGEACVDWVGALNNYGYGIVHLRKGPGGMVLVHRIAWESARGAIPGGMVIDHLCRNRRCVNVDHLEVVTRGENTLRGLTAASGHDATRCCSSGHAWTPENTYIRPTGFRACRQCNADLQRRKYAATNATERAEESVEWPG